MNRYLVLGLVNALILLALSGGAVFDIMDRCGGLTMCRRGPGLGTWAMAVLPLLLIAGAALVFAPRMLRAWKARRAEGAVARAERAEAAQADTSADDNARARLGRLSRSEPAPVSVDDDITAPAFDDGAYAGFDDSADTDDDRYDVAADGASLEQIFGRQSDDGGVEASVEGDADDDEALELTEAVEPMFAADAEGAILADDEREWQGEVVEEAVAESPAASHGWTFAVAGEVDEADDVDATVDDEPVHMAYDESGLAREAVPADRLSFGAAEEGDEVAEVGEAGLCDDSEAAPVAEDSDHDHDHVAAFDHTDGEEYGWPVVRSGDALAETMEAADDSYASVPIASFGAAAAHSETEVSPFASWLIAPGPVPRMRPAADTGFPWIAAMIGAVARSLLDHVDRRALGEFAAEVEAWVQIADEMPGATPIGEGDAGAFIGWLDTVAQHLFLFGARPSLDMLITHALAELLDRAADDAALADALPPVLLGGRESAADAA